MKYLFAAIIVLLASPVSASPTMIRIGYSTCEACHLSPQGAGLLTPYGKGIDVAQSLLTRVVTPGPEKRLTYDFRFLLGGQIVDSIAAPKTKTATASSMQAQARGSFQLSEKQRVTATVAFVLSSPTFVAGQPVEGDGSIVIPRAVYEYRPVKGVAITAGRDELPTGVGLPDPQAYVRKSTDLGVTTYPTSVKALIWSDKFQFTPFVFAPGGGEDDRLSQWGAGGLAGLDLLQHHMVVGISALAANSDAFARRSLGAYLRGGFGRVGVLAEHELTGRDSTAAQGLETQFVTGHTQVFFAPWEWLVTSLSAEDVGISDALNKFRFAPSLQMRVSDRVTVTGTMRDVFTGRDATRTRTYSILVAIKTVQ